MAEHGDIERLWEKALAAYKEDTKRDFTQCPLLGRLKSTDDLLTEVDRRQAKFKGWISKRRKIRHVLSLILAPLDRLSGIVSAGLSLTPFAPAAALFGATVYLVLSCKNVTEAYDWIEDLFYELSDMTARLGEYAKSFINPRLERIIIESLLCLLQIFGKAEKRVERGHFRQYLALVFLGQDKTVKDLVDRLDKLTTSEGRLVQSLVYSSVQQIAQNNQEIKSGVQSTEKVALDLQIAFTSSEVEDRKRRDDKLLNNSLRAPGFGANEEIFHQSSNQLVKGTCEWLLQHPYFNQWRDWTREFGPLLYVSGAEGTGKSFLATKAIMHLKEENPQDPQDRDSASIAYFFVREDQKQQLKDVNSILKALALQITAIDTAFRQYAVLQCKNPGNISTPRDTWKNLFCDFFGRTEAPVKRAFIVIDGLDKVEEQKPDNFDTLLNDQPCHLRVAAFGQKTMNIELKRNVVVTKSKNNEDIKRYVRERVGNVSIVRKWRAESREKEADELAETISTEIFKVADGSFIRASILLQVISGKARKTEILNTLENPPKELDDAVKQVLKRLASDADIENADLKEMLSWVLCTQRPLLLSELDVILRLKQNGEPYELLGDHMREKLASVFTLTYLGGNGESGNAALSGASVSEGIYGTSLDPASRGPSTDESPYSYALTPNHYKIIQVEFAHPSIGKYLAPQGQAKIQKGGPENAESAKKQQESLNDGDKAELSPDNLEIGIDVDKAHLHIASMCLDILCDDTTKPYNSELVLYSAECFMKHLQLISVSTAGLDPVDVKHVALQLEKLFSNQDQVKKLVDAAMTSEQQAMFLNTWFGQEQFRESIWQWIAEDFKNGKMKDSALFKSLADWCASIWLTKAGFNDEEYKGFPKFPILIYLGCRRLAGEDCLKDLDLKNLNNSFPLGNVLAETWKTLAKSACTKQTTYWHTGLGWALWEANQISAARAQFDNAIGEGDSAWKPKEMIARCSARQGHYPTAIKSMMAAIDILPDKLKWLKQPPWFMGYVVRWQLASGKAGDAVKSSRTAFELEPRKLSTMFYHIRALSEAHQYGDLVQFLGKLSQPDPDVEGGSCLIKFLSARSEYDVFDEIGVAISFAKPKECPGFLRAALDEALKRVEGSANPWTCCRIASFNFRYRQKPEGVVQIWEDAIKRTDATTYGAKMPLGNGRTLAIDGLSQFYYDKAVQARKSNGNPEEWVKELKRLAYLDRQEQADTAVQRTSNPSILLGTWLRKYSNQGSDEWKGYFRAKILEGIALLRDQNPENDQEAYASLGTTLLHAQQKEDAAAALAVTLLPLTHPEIKDTAKKEVKNDDTGQQASGEIDKPKTESQTGKDPVRPAIGEADKKQNRPVVQASGFAYWWRCAGRCEAKKEEYRELHFCDDCIEACFCGDCIALVKEDQLLFRRCSSKHNFFKAFPLDEPSAKEAAKLKGENVELNEEWIDQLQEFWQ